MELAVLYHISKEDLDGKTLYPRVPENTFTKEGKEDNTTPRVSFSPFLEGAIQSIVARENTEYNVYINRGVVDVTIPNNYQVPDQCLTGEVWVKEPVELMYLGKVKIGNRIETLPSKGYTRDDGAFIEVLIHEFTFEAKPSRKNGILVNYKFDENEEGKKTKFFE